MKVPDEFKLVDFPGGLYSAFTGIDQQTDMDALNYETDCFLAGSGWKRDTGRKELGTIIPRLVQPKSRVIIKWITILL